MFTLEKQGRMSARAKVRQGKRPPGPLPYVDSVRVANIRRGECPTIFPSAAELLFAGDNIIHVL